MLGFTLFAPTEVVFGPGSHKQTATLVKKHGGSNVFLVYGQKSAERSGLLDEIVSGLDEAGLSYTRYGGAMPNPHLSFARRGVQEAAKAGADFILAVGGGSAIDAAKAIAHGTKNPQTDIWKFWKREVPLEASLPIGVVLTISAAGSETSNSAVLTNTETGEKRGINTDFNRPRFAVMNPEFTYNLPKFQISCGIADILMHTMERYFTPENADGLNETTDELAEALLRVVIRNGPLALDNPSDYAAQSEIMWAGSISHNGLTGLGRTMDFSVHQLGHELGGRFDVAHGASLTTMWASWARFVHHICPPRFDRFATKVWGMGENCGMAAIDKTEAYFESIGMPTCFTQLGIGVLPDETLAELAHSCVHFGARKVGSFKPLDKDDVLEIYRLANR